MKLPVEPHFSASAQLNEAFFVIGIGASAGGQAALTEFLDHLSPRINAAIVIVTHLMRDHKSILSEILAEHTFMPVIKIERDLPLEKGRIYVMSENSSITLHKGWLIHRERDADIVNRNIDIFFESMAGDFGKRAVGIILSGGGSDGLKGAQCISEHGGRVLVQDPSTALVHGMPRSIINHDHPSSILSPGDLAITVNELFKEKLSL